MPALSDDVPLRVAGWKVDPVGHQLEREGVRRHVEPRAMDVLLRLAQDAPSVVTRKTLLLEVWGDTFVSDDAVSATIIKLRKAFDDDSRHPTVIETVPRSGYRLVADVEREDRPEPAHTPAEPTATGSRVATVMRCTIAVASPDHSDPDPAHWPEVMRRATAAVDSIVERLGGWTSEDSTGVLATFGAPLSLEHHADRALSAAAEILQSVIPQPSGALNTRVHIGIASGPVVVAHGPAQGVMVFGEPVTTASLLAAAAADGEALVVSSPAMSRPTSIAVKLEPVAVPHMPGQVRRLTRVTQTTGLWEARSRQGLISLKGRAEEFDRLQALLARVKAGRGQVVRMVGEPGAGKSRLLFELAELAQAQEFAIHVGHATPVDRHSPYISWGELIRSAAQQPASSSGEGPVDVSALRAVTNPNDLDSSWASIDPEVRRSRIVDAVVDALLPGDQPVLLALEDAHWADEASRSLTEAIATTIARRSCLLVVTTRPTTEDPFAALSYATNIRVDSLDLRQSAELLDSLVGSHPSLDGWKKLVLDRAGGTPLFLEESVRSGRASGALVNSGGQYVAGHSPDFQVPPSVQSLIADRIDHLEPNDRTLVCAAAVLGREIPEELLRSVAQLEENDWHSSVTALQREELLYQTTSGGRRALVFKHALTRDVAYLGISSGERRALHNRAANEISVDRAMSPEILAWHLMEAGRDREALPQLIAAATHANQAGSHEDSLTHLARARELLPAVPAADERQHLSLALELATGTALVQTLGPADPQVEAAYERARELAVDAGSPTERFQAVWGSWFVHLMKGDLTREREYGRLVVEASRELDDDALALEAHHVQWSGLTLAGSPLEAMKHSDIGIENYRPERHHWLTFSYGGHDPGVCARNLNALARWMTADVETAHQRSRAAIALANDLAHPYSLLESTQACLNMALLSLDHATLTAEATRLVDLVDEGLLPEITKGYTDGFLGAALALDGDLNEAETMMRHAAPVWSEFWGAWCFPLDAVYASVLADAGHVDEGLDHVKRTLSAAEDSGGHWWDAELLRVVAGLRLRRDEDVVAAGDTYRMAIQIAADQGALLLELRAASDFVELTQRSKGKDEARRCLADVVSRVPEQEPFADLATARQLLASHPVVQDSQFLR